MFYHVFVNFYFEGLFLIVLITSQNQHRNNINYTYNYYYVHLTNNILELFWEGRRLNEKNVNKE